MSCQWTRIRLRAISLSSSGGAEEIDPFLIATRLLHFAAATSLEGTYVFWCLVSWQAFRGAESVQGLQARLDRRLVAIAWASLLVAFATGAVWLVEVASQMSGQPLSAVMSSGVVGIVVRQTRFGEDWALRALLVVVLAVCLVAQGRTRKNVWSWIGLAAASAFIASLAWAGHGAAAEDLPFDVIHLPADILHLLATGAWLGALLPLTLLLAEVRGDGSSGALAVARTATSRFSILGISSVGTLLATGIINTWFLAGTIPALVGTLYGQLLLVKVALFAAMIAVASVNRSRLMRSLTDVASEATLRLRAAGQLCRNASIEACLGVFVLAIVAIIGVLPPGLHTEPGWPFPLRLDLGEIATSAQTVLAVAAVAFVLFFATTMFTAGRRRYRGMAVSIAGLILSGGVCWIALRPGIVAAYPTTFYAPTQAYSAPSVARGAPLYAANCTACHGAGGRGDGPLASKLPIRPADLTEPHLFAHEVGDIYWWVSKGLDNGVMPGFAARLTPDQRWDVINFVRARAAGILTDKAGAQITTAAAPALPDFAFEQNGSQNTLSQMVKNGPVLLVLFEGHAPRARLEQLAGLQPRPGAAGLPVVAVGLGPSTDKAPLIVEVSDDVQATLALFRSPNDGGETEFMLDRGANIRARWTASGSSGLADAVTLLGDAARVASIPLAAANHAGHAH
jgi:putative copper resistance protein D